MLLSGRNGWHSGIVANQWFDSLLKKDVNVVEDPAVVNIGGSGGGYGASPVNFSGFTVGDMLKKRTPGSRVVGISLKDRSAILMSGPRADAAYWFDTRQRRLRDQHVLREDAARLADAMERAAPGRLAAVADLVAPPARRGAST